MQIRAAINLTRIVKTRTEADEWFAEVRETLQGKTEATLRASTQEQREKVEITK